MAQSVKCLQCKHEFGTLNVHVDMVMHVSNPSVGGRDRLISSLLVSQSSQLVSLELVGDPISKNKVESNSRRQPNQILASMNAHTHAHMHLPAHMHIHTTCAHTNIHKNVQVMKINF